jgi:Protein of unknown function (DUF3140)
VAQELRQGDAVEWNTPQGKRAARSGRSSPREPRSARRKINASEDDPR